MFSFHIVDYNEMSTNTEMGRVDILCKDMLTKTWDRELMKVGYFGFSLPSGSVPPPARHTVPHLLNR